MKKRARIVSGLATLVAFLVAPLAEGSLTLAAPPSGEAPAHSLALVAPAPPSEPSEFSLFEGHELAAAAAPSREAQSFHPLAAVSLFKPVHAARGVEGRISSRNGTSFHYDHEGRRVDDDRYAYRWTWRGELSRVTVRPLWPGQPTAEDPNPQPITPPYADQQIRFEYDALGRVLSRTHLGVLPPGGDDDAVPVQRPFIEKREYLWDGDSLIAETAYGAERADGTAPLRWRKSYVPGASGLDDAVQVRVEIYNGSGSAVVSEKTYGFVRDEQGTVQAVVDESAQGDPAKPSVLERLFYSPFGEAHVESGLEVFHARFDGQMTQIGDLTGQTVVQSVDGATAIGGTLGVLMSGPVDTATLPAGVILERRLTDGSWGALTAAELAIGRGTDQIERLLLMPKAGWQKDTAYRLRLTTALKDTAGRSLSSATQLDMAVPKDGTFAYDKPFPTAYDSALAAGFEAGGALPGGQPMLFQGLWTDPVTGLGYARARWLDSRNAAWLSEDPQDVLDSPNVYGFVGQRPHEKTDPLGLFITPDTALDIAFIAYDVRELQKDPKSPLNWAAFGVDVLFAIIPGVTGGGPGLRLAFAGARGEVQVTERSLQLAEKATRRGVQGLQKIHQMASSHGPSENGQSGDATGSSGSSEPPKMASSHESPGRGSNHPRTREAAETGQEAHRQIEAEYVGKGYEKEKTIKLGDGTKVRKDAVKGNEVVVIKPDTTTGRAAGEKRVDLMKSHGWDAKTHYYDPTDPRYQKGSPTYIGPDRPKP